MAQHENTINISTPVPAYDKLAERWKVPELLMGGTMAMRNAHAFTLPPQPREPNTQYEIRWQGATLFNAYKRTLQTLSGKPFSRPMAIDNLPEYLQYLRSDCDNMSTPLERMVQLLIRDRINYGKSLAMVRMPEIEEGTSEAERRERKLRPYFSRVPASSLIGWTYSSKGELDTIRLNYIDEEPVADKDTGYMTHVRQVEVIEFWSREYTEVFTRDTSGGDNLSSKWASKKGKQVNPLGRIPLMISGRMVDTPMLEDLANLNLHHFRSRSDQDTILRVARVPLLFFAGWEKDDVETTVSVNNAFVHRSKDAKVSFVEITGASIEAGEKDLQHLEDQMLVMGADLLTLKPGNPTATAKAIDTSEKVSDLQAIVIDMELDLINAFDLAADFLGNELPDNVTVTMSKEFGVTIKQREELDILVRARQSKEISREQFLREIDRRGVFGDDFSIDEELGRLVEEDDKDHERKISEITATAAAENTTDQE